MFKPCLLVCLSALAVGFVLPPRHHPETTRRLGVRRRPGCCCTCTCTFRSVGLAASATNDDTEPEEEEDSGVPLQDEDQQEEAATSKITSLIEDDEWLKVQVQLAETVRRAVLEDLASSTEPGKVAAAEQTIDERIKTEIARLRGKGDYESGDLRAALVSLAILLATELNESKEMKALETVTREVDQGVKSVLADFCGKEEYEFGDVAKEIDARVKRRAMEFTGKETYEFGDVARELESRRKRWLSEYLGSDERAEAYVFGDVTKRAVAKFTGKDKYEFGDISKKVFRDIFGGGGDDQKKKEPPVPPPPPSSSS